MRDIRHSDEPVLARLACMRARSWTDSRGSCGGAGSVRSSMSSARRPVLPCGGLRACQQRVATGSKGSRFVLPIHRAWRTTYSDDFFGLHGGVVALNQDSRGSHPRSSRGRRQLCTRSATTGHTRFSGSAPPGSAFPDSLRSSRAPSKAPAFPSASLSRRHDIRGDVAIEDLDLEPLVDLLPFFSGRDGWRADAPLISALAAVAGCNNARWALQTLTPPDIARCRAPSA